MLENYLQYVTQFLKQNWKNLFWIVIKNNLCFTEKAWVFFQNSIKKSKLYWTGLSLLKLSN